MYDFNQALPTSRFPTEQNGTADICAVAINEEAFIFEWVYYHFALWFSHFYLYGKSPEFEMEQWASEKGRRVTKKHYPGSFVQFSAYNDCSHEYAVKNRHTWVAIFDPDEMLYLKDHNHFVDLLSERCQSGHLSFMWIRFGHQPLPMTERFQFRENVTKHRVKAIARVQDVDLAKKIINPHFVNLKRGTHQDVNGNEIVYPIWSNPSLPTNTAALHHYNTKSYEELIAKRHRGRADTDRFDFLEESVWL